MNKFIYSLACASLFFGASCSDAEELPTPEPPKQEEQGKPETPAAPTLKIGSYIRPVFYQTGQIDTKSMQTCNDLIFFTAEPYTAGDLHYEIPDCTAELNGVTHRAEANGRQGVAVFNGTASMNAGAELLHKVRMEGKTGEMPTFTFGTWIYVDEWTNGAHLFQRTFNKTSNFGLKMGAQPGELIFYLDQNTFSCTASQLKPGAWHHIALAHQANKKTAFFVDGKLVKEEKSAVLAMPFSRTPLHIGKGLKAKLDETFFNGLYLNAADIQNIQKKGLEFKNWNHAKTLAYWTYDESSQLGKDTYSWKTVMNDVRAKLTGKDIKFRLGIHHGDWKNCCKEKNRANFINQIAKVLEAHRFDGVDLDFEWPTTTTEFADYSATIVALKKKIGAKLLLSVSLHPTAYKISKEAIRATDWISLQCYGPSPKRFPIEAFATDLQAALKYGIPAEKLVAGMPFYGTLGKGGAEGTKAYKNFVDANLITDPASDIVTLNGEKYTINGTETIRKKVKYAKDNQLMGVMSWDLATDCNYDNKWSLQRAAVEANQ